MKDVLFVEGVGAVVRVAHEQPNLQQQARKEQKDKTPIPERFVQETDKNGYWL